MDGMTTKEKIVRQAIAQVQKKLAAIKELLYPNPLGRICEIRIEAQKILQQHGDDHATIARLLKPLGEEEKRMFALAKKQKNTIRLVDEQVALERELSDLTTELHPACNSKNAYRRKVEWKTGRLARVEGHGYAAV